MADRVEPVHPPGTFAEVEPLPTTPFEPYAATSMLNVSMTVLAGPRGSGKTTNVFDLVQRLVGAYAERGRDDVTTVVFSPRGVGYGDLPVRTVFDAPWLEQQMRQRGRDSSPLILVLDEVADRVFLQSLIARALFMNGRHLRMHVFVTLENVEDLCRTFRPCVDVYMLVNSWNVSVVLHDCFPIADVGLVRDALRTLRRHEMLMFVVNHGRVRVYHSIPREDGAYEPVHAPVPVQVLIPAQDAPDMPPHG
jgi:hypothetical protein